MKKEVLDLSPQMEKLLMVHLDALRKSIDEVDPSSLLGSVDLSPLDGRNLVVLSIGKQGRVFFDAFEEQVNARIVKTFIVEPSSGNRYTEEISPDREVYFTNHPIALTDSFRATASILESLDDLFSENGKHTFVVLVTGGSSAAFALPELGIGEENYVEIMKRAAKEGFDIKNLNAIRGFFDSVKAGKLAARYPHIDIFTFIISDVVDDDPRVVGSGPTVAGLLPSKEIGAWIRRQMRELQIDLPYEHLYEMVKIASLSGREGTLEARIVGTRKDLLDKLVNELSRLGINAEIVNTDLSGTVFEEAEKMFRDVLEVREEFPVGYQKTLIFAGEPTVPLHSPSPGPGGRVSTMAVLFVEYLSKMQETIFVGVATDGKDGTSPHPCYVVSPNAGVHLRALGGPRRILIKEKTGKALSSIGLGFSFGETNINLMDIYLLILG